MSSKSPSSPSVIVIGEKSKKALERQKREEERLERLRQKETERIQKEEEKKKREEEKQRKDAEKEAERLRKEEEKRKKDEERELDRLRKEEEKRKREEERIRKEEEKRKKDEEREQERIRKEDEKRRKDEEKEQERCKREEEKRKREDEKEQERLKKKMKLDEQEQKARKQAEFMHSFLKKTTPVPISPSKVSMMEVDSPETPNFIAMPFQLKSGMALAPVHRRPSLSLNSVRKELFVDAFENESPSFEPYLVEVKNKGGRKSKRTEVVKEVVDEDVQIMDPKQAIENPAEAGLIKWRWKLLQFDKNVRPPYWGTWKRRASRVRPRAPFVMEEDIDYDFDSDQEWEGEPEDGEDLGDKDDDDKAEDEKCSGEVGGEVESDEEDDFLVPHGYLSDDEGGVAEYRDKDILKTLEEEFYRDLKKDNINGLPIIETDNLDQYTMIFYPDEDESDIGDDGGDTDEDEYRNVMKKTAAVAVAVVVA